MQFLLRDLNIVIWRRGAYIEKSLFSYFVMMHSLLIPIVQASFILGESAS